MRAVWDAAGMKCDRTALDAAPRPKIPTDVKQNFVSFDVVVHPRNLHCFRMRIQHAGRECADNVTTHFKGLMDRRRLMDRAGNRFEILGVKSKRIEIPIPAERVERMMRMDHARKPRTVLHQDLDVFLAVDREHFAWRVEIAFRIGRAHSDLSLVIQVTLRYPYRAG